MESIKVFAAVFALSFFIHSFSVAHGTDKPGPNGGVIQMPGSYHTEVKIENNAVLVWLLDINFQNPSVENSSVSIEIGRKNFNCTPVNNHFTCNLKKTKITKGSLLVVKSTKEKETGAPARYKFANTKNLIPL